MTNDKQGNPGPGQVPEDMELLETVASNTECTGLIPTPPESEAEESAYAEIYPVPQSKMSEDKAVQREKGVLGNLL